MLLELRRCVSGAEAHVAGRPYFRGLKVFSSMTSFTDCLQTSFTLWPFGLGAGGWRWRGGRWTFPSSGFGSRWLPTGVGRAFRLCARSSGFPVRLDIYGWSGIVLAVWHRLQSGAVVRSQALLVPSSGSSSALLRCVESGLIGERASWPFCSGKKGSWFRQRLYIAFCCGAAWCGLKTGIDRH